MIKRNLGIRGAYGEKNFGDDALMYFLFKWAEKNDLTAYFIGEKEGYIYNFIPKNRYIFKHKAHNFFFDKLVLGGGTQFFSFENKPISENKLKLLFLNPRSFLTRLTTAVEKKYFYKGDNHKSRYAVGIGLGPFISDSEMEIHAKKSVLAMEAIFARDMFSFEFAKKQNEQSYLATDICFLPNIIDFKPYQKETANIKRIGIILRDWGYSKKGGAYLDKVIEEAKTLTKNNYMVDFILFKDENQCENQLSRLNYNVVKWDANNQTLNSFIEILSGYDLFISARFHGVVFASLLNIPSIAIEIEPKLKVTKELLGDGVKIWPQPFNDSLLQIIQEINYSQAKEVLKEAVFNNGVLAQKMFEQLSAMIKSK